VRSCRLSLSLSLVLVLVLGAALVACAPAAPQATPTVAVDCDPATWDPPPILTCEAAVNAAAPKVQLQGRSPIVRITFRYGPWCPPNARCFVGPMPNLGYVQFKFDDALGSVLVDVGVEAGRVLAGEPRPMLEELQPDLEPGVEG
jgi:hypothetical protein